MSSENQIMVGNNLNQLANSQVNNINQLANSQVNNIIAGRQQELENQRQRQQQQQIDQDTGVLNESYDAIRFAADDMMDGFERNTRSHRNPIYDTVKGYLNSDNYKDAEDRLESAADQLKQESTEVKNRTVLLREVRKQRAVIGVADMATALDGLGLHSNISQADIKILLERMKSSGVSRSIGPRVDEVIKVKYSIPSDNNVFSSSELFQAWTMYRMDHTLQPLHEPKGPDTYPNKTVRMEDGSGNVGGREFEAIDSPATRKMLDLTSSTVQISSLNSEIVYRQVVRVNLKGGDLYISPFIDRTVTFTITKRYAFEYLRAVYIVLVSDSLNRVIIYKMLNATLNRLAWANPFVLDEFFEFGGHVIRDTNSDTDTDNVVSLARYTNAPTGTFKSDNRFVDIARTGMVTFNLASAENLITDIYVQKADNQPRIYTFNMSLPLSDAMKISLTATSFPLATVIRESTYRMENYEVVLLLHPLQSTESKNLAFTALNKIRPYVRVLIMLERSLLEFASKVDRYTLYKLSNYTTIKKLFKSLVRVTKYSGMLIEVGRVFTEDQRKSIDAFFKVGWMRLVIPEAFYDNFINGIPSFFKFGQIVRNYFAREISSTSLQTKSNVFGTLAIGDVVEVTNTTVLDAFDKLYELVIATFRMKSYAPLIVAGNIMREYMEKVSAFKKKKQALVNRENTMNKNDFVANTVKYIDMQWKNAQTQLKNVVQTMVDMRPESRTPGVLAFAESLQTNLREESARLKRARKFLELFVREGSLVQLPDLVASLRPLLPGIALPLIDEPLERGGPVENMVIDVEPDVEVDDEIMDEGGDEFDYNVQLQQPQTKLIKKSAKAISSRTGTTASKSSRTLMKNLQKASSQGELGGPVSLGVKRGRRPTDFFINQA